MLAFLDWEKAFEKIQHDKPIIALDRLDFSPHYTDCIAGCFAKPKRFRQGCPLSPFVLVMICLDDDIQHHTFAYVTNNWIQSSVSRFHSTDGRIGQYAMSGFSEGTKAAPIPSQDASAPWSESRPDMGRRSCTSTKRLQVLTLCAGYRELPPLVSKDTC